MIKKQKDTSWGGVAEWYEKVVEDNDSYQEKVVKPNLFRFLGNVSGKKIVDMACGEGFFSRILFASGASVVGADIGKELIAIAKKKEPSIPFFTAPSHTLSMCTDSSSDYVVCVLALQNIEKVSETFKEVSRVLKPGGKFVFVLNHPSFRNPKKTSWGFDGETALQYRRVDGYMSESKIYMDMNPGEKNPKKKKFTISFHRPLQFFFKHCASHGLAITRLEEWISHKESEKGPKKAAEDKARHEIPLFMCVEATKIKN
jgi:ubiquinone/menaquinone biosynthesis C-methylase UbiE